MRRRAAKTNCARVISTPIIHDTERRVLYVTRYIIGVYKLKGALVRLIDFDVKRKMSSMILPPLISWNEAKQGAIILIFQSKKILEL